MIFSDHDLFACGFIQLPRPTTTLPREKPVFSDWYSMFVVYAHMVYVFQIPKPKPPTKWELFAKRKVLD